MIKTNSLSYIPILGIVIILSMVLVGCSGGEEVPPGEPVSTIEPTRTPAPSQQTTRIPTESVLPQPSEEVQEPPETDPPPTEISLQDTPQATVISPTPTEEATTPSTDSIVEDCINQAVFVADVTVPDGTLYSPGAQFEKTWRIKNSGTCDWENYTLVFAGGDILNAALNNPIPEVKAGQLADLSIKMQAPERGGAKYSDWVFESRRGERFGLGLTGEGKLWTKITVTYVSDTTTSPETSSPSTTNPSPSASSTVGDCTVEQNPGYVEQVLAGINNARTSNGLPPLPINAQLSAAALAHSTDMACKGFVDHSGSDGSTWYQRVAAQGYSNSASARENIYVGDPAFGGTPQGAVEWWMNSQVHRENILNPEITEVGIGYVYLTGSNFGGYYTLVMAKAY